MKYFTKALYVDLLHRIDLVIDDISTRSHHPDIKDRFIDQTSKYLTEIAQDLRNTLDNGLLEHESLTGNNLIRYNGCQRGFKAIHSYRYLPIKNYKDPEIFFFQIISKIYSEHRITAIPPIVSTISNHDYYYWAVPFFEIIALPAGEENSLLNLPDMYHEIGHLLHSMYLNKSCEKSCVLIEKHFNKEIVRVIDEGMPDHFKDELDSVKNYWLNSWVEEFACDLVGTYMTGAAYAWTNLKLIATGYSSSKIYESHPSHPADEARMRIIILMLEKLGLTQETNEVKKAWREFLKETESYKPNLYSHYYPEKLLKLLVDEVLTFYQNADLASYSELQSNGTASMAGILNDAWRHAKEEPMQYSEYERKIIEKLKAEFGLN